MSRGKHEIKRGRNPVVPIEQMVPADPAQYLPLDPEPTVATDAPSSGQAPPSQPEGHSGYWGRATGQTHLDPLVTPERPAPPPRPAAAIWVVPEVAVAPVVVPVKPVVTPTASTAPAVAPEAPESVAPTAPPVFAPRRRGAHVRQDDPLAGQVRGAHVKAEAPPVDEVRGAHVKADDPLAGEIEVSEAEALGVAVSGAHLKAGDPLAAKARAGGALVAEASSEETFGTPGSEGETSSFEAVESGDESDGGDGTQAGEGEAR
ncbi:MAG TPA: hypothetical protein VEH82_08695, partial [Acidimicrobiales bacterium]|nr:hypothetical protein [Acidimicrobiales bacterium]